MGHGKVYLVGAGPGAPDLLTVRAVQIMGRAEIVLHDALINKEILAYCAPECVLVSVGKRGGLAAAPQRQERIYTLLTEAAARYSTVVRLKGGDPGVFGRGGEEVAFLAARGIPWEVVPGISAGIGGLSLLGLPVTHRDFASSVTLYTGSQVASGDVRDFALPSPLSGAQTLVFYMCFRHITAIAQRLMAHGMPADTAAMCVSWLSYPHQDSVVAPLAQLGAQVAASQLEAPAIMVVGDVVRFWQSLPQSVAGPEGV
jgi:uroporphyrin-III C-methyltransferase